MRRFLIMIGVLSVAACTNVVPPPVEFGTPLRSRGAIPTVDKAHAARETQVTVQKGDTVYAIARRNKVSPRSLIIANGLKAPFAIHPGKVLQVPHPRIHQVKRGETIYGISRGYGVDMTLLARLNGVKAPYTIKVGEELVLPAANAVPPPEEDLEEPPVATAKVEAAELPPPPAKPEPEVEIAAVPAPTPAPQSQVKVEPKPEAKPEAMPAEKPQVVASLPPRKAAPAKPEPHSKPQAESQAKPTKPESVKKPALKPTPADTSVSRYGFSWPLRGKLLSDFGPKGRGLHNDGVNIRAANGAPVRAAADGTVAYAGNELRGYGNLLLIRHTNGWTSAYAHNSTLLVRRGQEVKRGTVIAKAGRTGGVNTTQLHFEIRKGKRAVDPIRYLP